MKINTIFICMLCLYIECIACKSLKKLNTESFTCETANLFFEKNWKYKSNKKFYQAQLEVYEAVESQIFLDCIGVKDTSWVSTTLGKPNEIREMELVYYLQESCHPPGKVCEELVFRFWPKTGKIAKVLIQKIVWSE